MLYHTNFFTPAKEIIFYLALSVCLSVCLLATSRKNFLLLIRWQFFTKYVSVEKDLLIKFWARIWIRIWEFFEGFFNTTR